MPTNENKVPKRILSSLLASVSAGVVPRVGAPYIAIGRDEEVKALLDDLQIVEQGGAGMRFIVGKYGSGKSFLLQLIRGYAVERGFITADADLSPERRLCGAKGTGRATYCELMRNLASKSSPDGAALPVIISKWFSSLQADGAAKGFEPGTPELDKYVEGQLFAVIRDLESQIGGFDFAVTLRCYYRALCSGDELKKSACLRWLRAEYTTKTEARTAIGVSSLIDDDSWYDYIKLMAVFFRRIGYKGFVVIIDECVNLYKISNRISRENNYEKILAMFNDTLQSKAEGLELILGGTPQFLEDSRRGLYSYEALRSRLFDGHFSSAEFKNLIGPVIRLRRLSDEELYALVVRITRLHGQYYGVEPRIIPGEQEEFIKLCLQRAGADTLITPREIIRDYMSVLNILMQNPDATVAQILKTDTVSLKHTSAGEDDDPTDEESNTGTSDVKPEAVKDTGTQTYDKSKFDFKPEDIDI